MSWIPSYRTLFEMSWTEVEELSKQTDLALLCFGACEEHGPHLPIGADSIMAFETAGRVVNRLEQEGIKVLLAPPIIFGISPRHMSFPGTVTLRPETLISLVKDIGSSLIKHGFRRLIFYPAHVDPLEISSLTLAARELIEGGAEAYVVNTFPKVKVESVKFLRSSNPESELHGGERESAKVLASRPDLVHIERAKRFVSQELLAARQMGMQMDHWLDMREYSPMGYMGDPTVATPETGNAVFDIEVEEIVRFVKSLTTRSKKQ